MKSGAVLVRRLGAFALALALPALAARPARAAGAEIDGTMSYAYSATNNANPNSGTYVVILASQAAGNNSGSDDFVQVARATMSSPGAFRFVNVPDGSYTLSAFRDIDGSGELEAHDPWGQWQIFTATTTGTFANQINVQGGAIITQPGPFNFPIQENPAGSISGSVTYNGTRTGTLFIQAMLPSNGCSGGHCDGNPMATSTFPWTGPGTVNYSLLVPPATGYSVQAFINLINDPRLDGREPSANTASMGQSTFSVNYDGVSFTGVNATGKNLTMVDPGTSGATGFVTITGTVSYSAAFAGKPISIFLINDLQNTNVSSQVLFSTTVVSTGPFSFVNISSTPVGDIPNAYTALAWVDVGQTGVFLSTDPVNSFASFTSSINVAGGGTFNIGNLTPVDGTSNGSISGAVTISSGAPNGGVLRVRATTLNGGGGGGPGQPKTDGEVSMPIVPGQAAYNYTIPALASNTSYFVSAWVDTDVDSKFSKQISTAGTFNVSGMDEPFGSFGLHTCISAGGPCTDTISSPGPVTVSAPGATSNVNFVLYAPTFQPPPAPPDFHLTARSTGTVTWGWSNAVDTATGTGFRVVSASSMSISSDLPVSAVSYGDGFTVPLATNTPVQRALVAFNVSGLSTTTFVTNFTAAMPASGTAVTNITSNTVSAVWASNTNPVGTQYVMRVSTDPGFGIVNGSSQTPNLGATVPGLLVNTTYYVRVVAYNGDGVAAAPDVSQPSTATYAVQPTTSAFTTAQVSITSATFTWGASVNPAGTTYVVKVTTDPMFTVFTSSALTTATSFTPTVLSTNTPYYFAVRALGFNGVYSAPNQVSTTTLAAPPASSSVTFMGDHDYGVSWNANGNPPGTTYVVDASTDGFASVSLSSFTLNTSVSQFGALQANTTYNFLVLAANNNGVPTSYTLSVPLSSSTNADAPFSTAPNVTSAFSITEQWLANTNSTTTVYQVQISTDPTFVLGTQTFNGTSLNHAFTGLSAASQYFAKVSALGNNSQYTAFTPLPSTFTFILPPGPVASTFTAVDTMDATYNWSATSSSGTLPPGTAYVAQASTSSNFTGAVFSSTTLNTNAVFAVLAPNTTYFFQVESSNTVNVSGFVNAASTTTPAAAPLGLVSKDTATTSVGLSWYADANPPGTIFELWRDVTNAFNSGSLAKTQLTSTTTVVSSLTPNSNYYFKVRALGNNGVYTAFDNASGPLQAVATLPTAPSSGAVTGLGVSSMTANWGANSDPTGTLYSAQIATGSGFGTLTTSTVTTATSYAFTSLGSNTTYYLQVQALGFGGVNSAQTALPTTVTLANVPAIPAALNANLTSVGLSWANGGNAAGTQYDAQIATDPAFGTLTASSQTTNLASTFTALSSNDTYYLRVQAVNNQGVGTLFTLVTTTSTMVAAPVPAPYTAVSSVSLTSNWNANGNGPTVYTVQLGTAVFPTAVTASSVTLNTYAIFAGLNPSTTYFTQVQALGNDGTLTGFTNLNSTLTFLSAPFGGAYSNVTASAATVAWGSSNGAGTVYLVNVSTMASFAPLWSSSSTLNLSAAFGQGGQGTALGPDVTYYFEVQAQAPSNGQTSLFVSLGSTVTPVNQPSGTTVINVASTTVTLDWAAVGNPAGTLYEIWSDLSNSFTTSPTKTAVALTTGTVVGLTNNSTYYFKVRAVNFAAAGSPFDATQTVLTLPPAPSAPGTPAGTALGVSSVNWTWTAATFASSYTVFSASAGVPIGGGTPLSFTEVGLSTNYPAGLFVAGDNGSGQGALSAQTTVYTLAMPPTGTAYSNVLSTSATLSWSLNSNPSTTTAEVQRSTDGVTFSPVFLTTPTSSAGTASFIDASVVGCTTYTYRVRDWNGSGIPTVFDSTKSFETKGTTPSAAVGFVASPASNNLISLTWTPSPTEGIDHYILYTDSGTGTLSPTPLAPVIASTVTSLTVGPFVSSAAYTFKLDAFHRCGIEETLGVTAVSPSTGTLANVRASVVSPLSGQRVNGNAVTFQATLLSGDPTQVSQVSFQYAVAGSSNWITIPAGLLNPSDSALHPNPATSAPYVIHLDIDDNNPVTFVQGNTYDIRAVAVNVAGSSDTAPGAITFLPVGPALRAPNVDVHEMLGGGVVTKTVYVNSSISNTLRVAGPNANDPSVTVQIPGNSLVGLSSTTVVASNILVAVSTPGPSGQTGVGNAVEIQINGQATTYLASGSQALITMSYPLTANPNALQVWAFDETAHTWGALSTSGLDTTNHTISGLTSHFSIFQIFPTATTVQADTSKVRVYPVPFRPSSPNADEGRPFVAGNFSTGIVFDNLPGTASIKIYTLSGRLVDEFDASTTNGKVQWDVRNRDGRDVATGGYFAVISSPGSKTIVRKLLIIR